eukprot:394972-Pyramimonas_sp.AAC.1
MSTNEISMLQDCSCQHPGNARGDRSRLGTFIAAPVLGALRKMRETDWRCSGSDNARPKDFKVSDQILPLSEWGSEPSDGAGTNAGANEELPPD